MTILPFAEAIPRRRSGAKPDGRNGDQWASVIILMSIILPLLCNHMM